MEMRSSCRESDDRAEGSKGPMLVGTKSADEASDEEKEED